MVVAGLGALGVVAVVVAVVPVVAEDDGLLLPPPHAETVSNAAIARPATSVRPNGWPVRCPRRVAVWLPSGARRVIAMAVSLLSVCSMLSV